MSRQLILCCLAALASFALACDDAKEGSATPAPPAETPPPAETAVSVRLSGIPAVDRIVGMVAARDGAGLASALVVHWIPCTVKHVASGQLPMPPLCAASQSEGTLQESVLTGGCARGWMRAEDERALWVADSWSVTLYAAAEDLRTPGTYLLVFVDPTLKKTVLVMTVSADGIEDTSGGCGNPPLEQVAPSYLRVVIPPPP